MARFDLKHFVEMQGAFIMFKFAHIGVLFYSKEVKEWHTSTACMILTHVQKKL